MKIVRPVIVFLFVFTVITGVMYPLVVTGIAQLFFPAQANGSIIVRDGQAVGSLLIGQPFDDPRYFWGRPSATAPFPYNAASSSGSNLSQSNPAVLERAKTRIAALRKADPEALAMVPTDLVTASGSGLDPHISPAAAAYQVIRVAKARGLEVTKVQTIVEHCMEERQFGILGEPRINVLTLNLAMDVLTNSPRIP